MKRRLVRCAKFALILLIVVPVVAVLLVDKIAARLLENEIKSETGLMVSIEKVRVGLKDPLLTVQNLVIFNKPEYGGGSMIEVPEIHLDYKRHLLSRKLIAFKEVRVHIETLSAVETKDGKINLDDFQKEQTRRNRESKNKKKKSDDFQFGGIDQLAVTLGRATFTSAKRPNQNKTAVFGIRNKTYSNIRDEKDLQTILIALILEGGASFLLGPNFIGPAEVSPANNNSPAR